MPKRKIELWIDTDRDFQLAVSDFEQQMDRWQVMYKELLTTFYRKMNYLYLLIGCPQGDSHEGLMQWMAQNPEWQATLRGERYRSDQMRSALGFFSCKKHYERAGEPPGEGNEPC